VTNEKLSETCGIWEGKGEIGRLWLLVIGEIVLSALVIFC
jgi:hypothetical protein